MADTDAFFTPPPTADYTLQPSPTAVCVVSGSALTTPHETTTQCLRYFPAPLKGRPTNDLSNVGTALAVPQAVRNGPDQTRGRPRPPAWNSDPEGHARSLPTLAWNGLTRCPEPALSRSSMRPSSTAPTTSSAPTSRGRAGLPPGRARRRGARSRWLAMQGYDRIVILAPAWDRAWRC